MTRRLSVFAILVSAMLWTAAGAADMAEELRFVQALRSERYYDLADQYLTRLEKTAPPTAAADLALERLNILLDRASDEPDTQKRLARYEEVRTKFQEMARTAAPTDRRAAAARLALANVTKAQASVQLSVALSRTGQQRLDEGEKARLLLIDAQKQLKEVAVSLDDQARKAENARTPDELKEKARLEASARQVRFDLALNLFDQAITYPDTGSTAIRKLRSDKMIEANKAFEDLSRGATTSPPTWMARAWLARCKVELGESDATITDALDVVLKSKEPAASDGRRLALYFKILRDEEKAQDKTKAVDEGTRAWLAEFGRFKNTPEGFGVRYLRAKVLMARANQPGLPAAEKDRLLASARILVDELDQTDNEYSDRAFRLKLVLIEQQGGFKKPIGDLKKFDECFLRARFELYRIGEDLKEKEVKEQDRREIQEKHYQTALAALQHGLTLDDAKVDRRDARKAANVATARASLPYYYTQLARSREAARDTAQANRYYREAVRTGAQFVRDQPDADQADQAAIYVIDAYTRLIGKDAGPEDRAAFTQFATFVEEKWPDSNPGNLARQRRASLLLNDKTASPTQHIEDVKKAILLLGRISPKYPGYPYAMYTLADAALQADSAKYDPIKEDGKPEISYRQRALSALRLIPDITGADVDSNRLFLLSRTRLGDELYKEGRAAVAAALTRQGAERDAALAEAGKSFTELDQLAAGLLILVPRLEFVGREGLDGITDMATRKKEEEKIKEQEARAREEYRVRLEMLRLFAAYGEADAWLKSDRFGAAADRLNPIVDRIRADKLPELRANPDLALVILNVSLKANLRANKPDRVLIAVQAMVEYEVARRVAAAEDTDKVKVRQAAREPAVVAILRLLGDLSKVQVDELTSRNDMAGLKEFQDGMKNILVALEKEVPNPGNETLYYYARAWAALGIPEKALVYLDRVTEPKAMAPKEEVAVYRLSRILQIRILRDGKQYAQARKVIDESYGPPPDKKGWGSTNIEVLKLAAHLEADEGNFVEGFKQAKALLNMLNKKLDGPTADEYKSHYMEMYHLYLYCIVKNAHGLKKPEDREQQISRAATFLRQLEGRFPDFGGGESKKRFDDLLASEPELKAFYVKMK